MLAEHVDILALGPHPDDVELGCGGTLVKLAQQGYRTAIIDLTEGEMGTRGTVAERYEESADAAKILGAIGRENLQIPDANIYNNDENRLKIIRAIRRLRPAIVFAPYPNDRHPDHVHSSNLITDACFYAGLKKMDPGNHPAFRPKRLVYYMMTYEFQPTFLVDISEQYETKLAAVKAHKSQFYNPGYDGEETFISSKGFFDAVEFRMRHYGWKCGVTYAEPFWVREALVMDDIFPVLTRNKM